MPFDPSETQIRKKSKLGKSDEVTEPAISSVGGVPDISLKKPVELKGGFAQLAKKGTIHFTSYNTTERQDNDEYT
jgi:hypothetical protein